MIKPYVSQLNFEIPDILQEHVVSIIIGKSSTNVKDFVNVYPTGFPLIIYVFDEIPTLHFKNYSTKVEKPLVVAGQIVDEEIQMEINGKLGQIGVVLNPTTPYYLFHKSGDYFLNSWKDFCHASPLPAENLIKKLNEQDYIEEYVNSLFSFLQKLLPNRIKKNDWLDHSLETIFKANGLVTQEFLASNSHCSLRHFRRTFKKIIGVSPKYYCKVIQLNTIFELLKLNDTEKLHHIALDCGYYDQAHFINDFKRFIGDSPGNFLNGNHTFVQTYLGRKNV